VQPFNKLIKFLILLKNVSGDRREKGSKYNESIIVIKEVDELYKTLKESKRGLKSLIPILKFKFSILFQVLWLIYKQESLTSSLKNEMNFVFL
jgi:hypothetical protein